MHGSTLKTNFMVGTNPNSSSAVVTSQGDLREATYTHTCKNDCITEGRKLTLQHTHMNLFISFISSSVKRVFLKICLP